MEALSPPRHVVRVLHHHRVFDQATYRDPAQGKAPEPGGAWPFEAADYVADGQLYLSACFAASEDARKTLLVFDHATTPASQQMLDYQQMRSPPNLLTFPMRENQLWLATLPTTATEAGYPERPGFDVAPLLPGQPVRLALNARWWYRYDRRGPTYYFEWDFIVEYFGQFDAYQLSPGPRSFDFDPTGLKLIDLRKELY